MILGDLMGSLVGIAVSVTGASRGVGVGITYELFLGDVPVVRCSWSDLLVSRVRGAVR
jgi:hypothetical protein